MALLAEGRFAEAEQEFLDNFDAWTEAKALQDAIADAKAAKENEAKVTVANSDALRREAEAEANDDGSYSVYVGSSEDCKSRPNQIDIPEGGAALTLRMYRPTSFEAAQEFEKNFQSDNKGK